MIKPIWQINYFLILFYCFFLNVDVLLCWIPFEHNNFTDSQSTYTISVVCYLF